MHLLKKSLTLVLALLTIITLNSHAASQPDAQASDPGKLGLMQGFPPPPDKRVMQPDSNFFSFPKLRWTVCHIRELMPTKQVSRGLGPIRPLTLNLDGQIDSLSFMPLGSDEPMSCPESLAANYTDGLLIIHRGEVVYEYFNGCLDEAGKHAAMSMTKSFTGLLAEILVAEGRLDENALVKTIIPELADSAFGSATVRQVMDMTTSLDYSEDYSDPNAGIWQYSFAANPMPKPAGYTGPVGYYEYLQTVQPAGEHGQAFGYKTVNTDVLGWLLARSTGKGVARLIAERLWQPLGMEQDAYMTVDALGTEFAGGGLSAGLRDLGRFGLLLLNGGQHLGQQVIPTAAIDSIRSGADNEHFAQAGYSTLPGGSYRGMWWVFHNDHGAFAARGVHGQTIYIDPTADMVLVRFSSHPSAKNGKIDPTSLPAYQAVAEYLLSKTRID
jgi:CubicO group peptidase (beta-lactamase class C family)